MSAGNFCLLVSIGKFGCLVVDGISHSLIRSLNIYPFLLFFLTSLFFYLMDFLKYPKI